MLTRLTVIRPQSAEQQQQQEEDEEGGWGGRSDPGAMASERPFDVTRQSVLDYLRASGGRVPHADLVAHFRGAFPEGREERAAARAAFKRYVDGVALVRPESGVKYVCLRRKFREEGDEPEPEPAGREDEGKEEEKEGGEEEKDPGEPREAGAAPGSGSGSDTQVRLPHVFPLASALPETEAGGPSERCDRGRLGGEMGNRQSFRRDSRRSGRSAEAAVPRIAVIEASPLPAEEPAFSLPPRPAGPAHCEAPEQVSARRAGAHQGEGEDEGRDHDHDHGQDQDQDQEDGLLETGSLSGGGGGGSPAAGSPAGSRRHFLEVMMSSSPQLRRSLGLRTSVCLSTRSDGDSLASDEEPRATAALEPLEHEWMLCASDGEWASLQRLLAADPGLVLRRDFVSGFTCLHWAAKQGKAELLALLVRFARQQGLALSVDARSSAGYTPLHVAAVHGHLEVVKLLVGAYGADVDARDYSGRKACQYLARDVGLDLRDILGADDRDRVDGARRRFPKVLGQAEPWPRGLLAPEEPGGGARLREKPVRRKSSLGLMRPRLERLRLRASQIIHSTTFHSGEELDPSPPGSPRARPKTHFFG